MSLLQKLKQGKVDALKATLLLKEKSAMSQDVVLMADEMYFQYVASVKEYPKQCTLY